MVIWVINFIKIIVITIFNCFINSIITVHFINSFITIDFAIIIDFNVKFINFFINSNFIIILVSIIIIS